MYQNRGQLIAARLLLTFILLWRLILSTSILYTVHLNIVSSVFLIEVTLLKNTLEQPQFEHLYVTV